MKTKRGNVTVITIIVVVVAITAGAIGWLAAKKTQAPMQKEAATQSVPVAQTQTAAQLQNSAPIDEITNWQVYENRNYGYSVNYPNGWFFYVSDASDVFFQPNKEEPNSIPGSHADAFEIKVVATNNNLSLEQVIKHKYDKEGLTFSQEAIFIGGENGLKVKSICEGLGCGAPEWFVMKNGYLYEFNSNLGYSIDFDKIVSSFKFTNSQQTDEMANWKTYTDTKNGFEFKYPNGWPSPIITEAESYGSGGYPTNRESAWTLSLGNKEKTCEGSACYIYELYGYKGDNYSLFISGLKNNEQIEIKSENMSGEEKVIVYQEAGICGNKRAFVFGDKMTVKFSAKCGYDDQNIADLFDKILSTFRFTK